MSDWMSDFCAPNSDDSDELSKIAHIKKEAMRRSATKEEMKKIASKKSLEDIKKKLKKK